VAWPRARHATRRHRPDRRGRRGLAWKCSDLSAGDLRRRAVPTSNLSLLGLVRHLAEVERQWWTHAAGTPQPYRWCSADRPDADFDDVARADVDEAFAAWAEECERGRQVLAASDLDGTFGRTHYTFSVRWLAMHLVEEYARHNGHADLLREAIDGQVGE
ncbi:DUF664 domain-containing protein, partial [Acidimicrobiaceae bacterium USS-CC1]|nr:DUF664 domain-containing protein [Acidiferrimicrobium australe]